ncbi:MAG: hypothetical protein ACTSQJ_00330 [Promethearchaeota archaeon]
MNKKPDLLSNKEFDKLKADLGKELKKLKPRKPTTPSRKRLESMAQKKAEGSLDGIKKMIKDKIELEYLKKMESDLVSSSSSSKDKDTKIKITDTSSKKKKKEKKKESDNLFSKLSPKDLKGLDDEALEKYLRLKAIEKDPSLGVLFLNNKKDTSNDIRDLIELVKFLNEQSGSSEKKSIIDKIKEQKLIERLLGNNKKQDDLHLKYIFKMQEQQMKLLKEIYKEKENLWKEKLEDLEARVDQNPLDWLKNQKETMELLRSFFGGIKPSDIEAQLKLKKAEQDFQLKLKEWEAKQREEIMKHNKSAEMTSLIKTGFQDFSQMISKAIGEAVGKVGKEQLSNIGTGAMPTIPIEQVEQNINKTSLPDINAFSPLPSNLNLQTEPILKTSSLSPNEDLNSKKKYKGFRISESDK